MNTTNVAETGLGVNDTGARMLSGDITSRTGSAGRQDGASGEGKTRLCIEWLGGCLRVKVSGIVPSARRGLRGEIAAFSSASRRRLFDWLSAVDWEAAGVVTFITVTYGQRWPVPTIAKDHLRRYWQGLHRLGAKSVMWKLEFQKRGAPHFHLMVIGLPFTPKEQLQEMWGRIVGKSLWDHSGPSPRIPFVRIEAIRSPRGVRYYVGKYIAKANDNPEAANARVAPESSAEAAVPVGLTKGTYLHAEREVGSGELDDTSGRYWGVKGRRNVPLGRGGFASRPCTARMMKALRIAACRHYYRLPLDGKWGFTLWTRDGQSPEDVLREADGFASRLTEEDVRGTPEFRDRTSQ